MKVKTPSKKNDLLIQAFLVERLLHWRMTISCLKFDCGHYYKHDRYCCFAFLSIQMVTHFSCLIEDLSCSTISLMTNGFLQHHFYHFPVYHPHDPNVNQTPCRTLHFLFPHRATLKIGCIPIANPRSLSSFTRIYY